MTRPQPQELQATADKGIRTSAKRRALAISYRSPVPFPLRDANLGVILSVVCIDAKRNERASGGEGAEGGQFVRPAWRYIRYAPCSPGTRITEPVAWDAGVARPRRAARRRGAVLRTRLAARLRGLLLEGGRDSRVTHDSFPLCSYFHRDANDDGCDICFVPVMLAPHGRREARHKKPRNTSEVTEEVTEGSQSHPTAACSFLWARPASAATAQQRREQRPGPLPLRLRRDGQREGEKGEGGGGGEGVTRRPRTLP